MSRPDVDKPGATPPTVPPVIPPPTEERVDPDRDLIDRVKKKQTGAFEQLVRKYQDRVYNLSFRFLREREIAEEVAQDVFVSIYKHIDGFKGEAKFSTWLFRVVANHCHNKSKYLRRRRHKLQDSIDVPIETEDGERKRELADDPLLSPEELSTRRNMNEAIQDAISHLDEDHRVIVLLRDVEDLSYEEIGEILGLPEGTVKSRLHRARNELRERLSKTYE